MAIATIASQQAITASPVSAATAAMIGLLAPHHLGLVQILIICVPSTLIAVFIASLVQLRVGKELKDDPEYQRRLASGEVESHRAAGEEASAPLKAGAMTSALIFLAGVVLVVLAGIFPELRTVPGVEKPVVLSMPIAIAIVMLGIAALILTVTKAPVADVPKCKTCQSGITAIIGILGLAWLGDTFINANRDAIIGGLSAMASAAPWTFAFGLFFASVLLYSQAATTRALMPLGLSLGIWPPLLIGMFPAVNGYFLIPNYGTIIAAINFDRSGTTRIGKYVINHSFLVPGLVSTVVAVAVGLLIGSVIGFETPH
jgi:anaerobic C4-dicarboxylate transporter DcuA